MKVHYLFTLSVLILIFAVQSCTDGFQDMNTNPHASPDLDPGVQIATVMLDLSGSREELWRYDLGIASPKMQHLGGSWWTQHGGQYRIVERSHWYSMWEVQYPREVKNIVDVVERTRDVEQHHNTHHAARILKVYIFSRLTDMYGDIPYTAAGMGFYEQVLQPWYDRQEDIYADFFVELEDAVAQLDATKGQVSGDLFFFGDVEKWKRFGNSLRMRLGFRIIKVDPAESHRQVTAAIQGGVMQSNDDIAMMRHSNFSFGAGENRGNGRSQVFRASDNAEGYRLVSTLVNYMDETEDPRLTRYGGTYLGITSGSYGQDITEHVRIGLTPGAMWWNEWADYGDVHDSEGNYVAYLAHGFKHMMPSRYVSALDAPFFHFTYAETELYLAEAVARGWIAGDAESHFRNASLASFGHVGMYPGAPAITQEEIDAFFAATPFPANAPDQIRFVNEQHWVNFFLNGVEAYSNYRRSGYPELQHFTGVEWYAPGAPEMPRRLLYPEREAVLNTANYQETIARMGGRNDWLVRVWWDVP